MCEIDREGGRDARGGERSRHSEEGRERETKKDGGEKSRGQQERNQAGRTQDLVYTRQYERKGIICAKQVGDEVQQHNGSSSGCMVCAFYKGM